MSSLLATQITFTHLMGTLLVWCAEQGHQVTLGDAYRDPALQEWYVSHGLSWTMKSRHLMRLAVDLNLILADGSLAKTKADYEPLGVYWESLDPQCVWGGRWATPDADHFEVKPPV